MPDAAYMLLLMAAPMLLGAWHEYVRGSRRDAGLLAAFGTGGMVAGGAILLV